MDDRVLGLLALADKRPTDSLRIGGTGELAHTSAATASGLLLSVPQDGQDRIRVRSRGGSTAVDLRIPIAPGVKRTIRDGIAVYHAEFNEDALAMRVVGGGLQLMSLIGAESSQRRLAFSFDSAQVSELVAVGSAINVLDKHGNAVAGLGEPWAVDASGQPVATHYEISGLTVFQIVEPGHSTQYPVLADPYLFVDLIHSAAWRYNSPYGWTLEVSPTDWARFNAGNSLVGALGWEELYEKYWLLGLNRNLGAMRDQYMCHQIFVAVVSPTKATWNLDEWRADVGISRTIAAKCNPGGTYSFD